MIPSDKHQQCPFYSSLPSSSTKSNSHVDFLHSEGCQNCPQMPLERLQNLPGKKYCHDFSIFNFRITKIVSPIYCKQFQISHCGNPIEAGSCLLCKMAPIWGGVQFASQLLDIWKHVERWKQKYSLLPSFVLLSVIWGSVQCVGGDGAPNYWICTNWRQGWGGRGGRVGIGQIILWKFTKNETKWVLGNKKLNHRTVWTRFWRIDALQWIAMVNCAIVTVSLISFSVLPRNCSIAILSRK